MDELETQYGFDKSTFIEMVGAFLVIGLVTAFCAITKMFGGK